LLARLSITDSQFFVRPLENQCSALVRNPATANSLILLPEARQRVDRELKKGSAELLILSLIESRARHGYEIAKLIETRSQGIRAESNQ
jgi:hypothetical protein